MFCGEPYCQYRRWVVLLLAAVKGEVRAFPQGLRHGLRHLYPESSVVEGILVFWALAGLQNGYDAHGLAYWDVYQVVLTPSELVLQTSLRDLEAAEAYEALTDLPDSARLRRVRVVRDYTKHDRRTSRSIALTDPGRDFYESALYILDDFENATSRIGRGQTAPKGLIRVTVPPTFARLQMVSTLPAFFAT
jgi:hypothetical protein